MAFSEPLGGPLKMRTRNEEELKQDMLLLPKLVKSLPLEPYEELIKIAFSKPEFIKDYQKGESLGFTIGVLAYALRPLGPLVFLAFIIGPPIHFWIKINRWLKPSPLQNSAMIKEESKLLRHRILYWWVNLVQLATRRSPEKKIALNSELIPEGYAYTYGYDSKSYLKHDLGEWAFTEPEQIAVANILCAQIKEKLDKDGEIRLPDRCLIKKEGLEHIAEEIKEVK